MKKIKIIVMSLFVMLFVQSCKAQSKLQLKQEYSTKIIGTWKAKEDVLHKLEFLSDGSLKTYYDGELISNDSYSIKITCDGETMGDERIFLQTVNEYGDIACMTLEAVDEDTNSILSMTTDRGNLYVYTKVN